MTDIPLKRVYLDGCPLNLWARTTTEAAEAAVKTGAHFNPHDPIQRTQHVGEGPTSFHVSTVPGEYKGPRR
jgi:hypothetical protein